MARRSHSFLIAVFAVVAMVPVADAQEGDYRAALPKRGQGCFSRNYDAAHLARNPQQTVTTLTIARGVPELKREAIEGPEAPEIGLRLYARLRSERRAGPEGLDCHGRQAEEGDHQGRVFLQCVSVCGRGHLDIVADGKDRLLVRIGGQVEGRFVADAVGVGARCDRDAGVVWLGDATGDRSFVLERVPLRECGR